MCYWTASKCEGWEQALRICSIESRRRQKSPNVHTRIYFYRLSTPSPESWGHPCFVCKAHVALHARINFKNLSIALPGSATLNFVQCLVLERWLNCIIQCITILFSCFFMQLRIYELNASLDVRLVYKKGIQVTVPHPNTANGFLKDEFIGCLKILYEFIMWCNTSIWQIWW